MTLSGKIKDNNDFLLASVTPASTASPIRWRERTILPWKGYMVEGKQIEERTEHL